MKYSGNPPVPAQPAVPAQPKLKWEHIGNHNGTYVHRAKVPGGWLVELRGSLAFVPDANHLWDGGSPP
jgi:hypothetical protein